MVDYKKRCSMLEKEIEWAMGQIEYFEDHAEDIRSEAYNCRQFLSKIIGRSSPTKPKEQNGRQK